MKQKEFSIPKGSKVKKEQILEFAFNQNGAVAAKKIGIEHGTFLQWRFKYNQGNLSIMLADRVIKGMGFEQVSSFYKHKGNE